MPAPIFISGILRKYFIVINPVSGGRKSAGKLEAVKNRLRDSGFGYEVFETTADIHPDKIIKKYFDPTSFTDLMIIGGDGTINEAVNGLDSLQCPISLISTGTGNDLARSLLGTLDF